MMNQKKIIGCFVLCGFFSLGIAQNKGLTNAEIPGKPSDPKRKLSETVPVWPKGSGKDFSGAYPEIPPVKNIDESSTVQLTLPKIIFGMTGTTTKVYFKNLVCTYDKSILRFQVDSKVGKSNDLFWEFTPQQPGDYPLSITVKDTGGRVVGKAETVLKVAHVTKGNDRNAVIMIIGDSIMGGAQIANDFQAGLLKRGNPNIRLMGSHCGGGKPLVIGKAAVEAYGGWTWGAFISLWRSGEGYNRRTKFMKQEKGKLVFAVQDYLNKYNAGKAPDVVIIYLGCNDIALGKMNTIEKRISDSFRNRKIFLTELRKAMPNTIFALALLAPANAREAAFERNYKGEIPCQQYHYNQFTYVKRTLQEFQNDKNLSLIPFYVSVDDMADYPEFNAVHPNRTGQQNLALQLEMWFKNIVK